MRPIMQPAVIDVFPSAGPEEPPGPSANLVVGFSVGLGRTGSRCVWDALTCSPRMNSRHTAGDPSPSAFAAGTWPTAATQDGLWSLE